MRNDKLITRIFQRLLKESSMPNINGFGAYTFNTGAEIRTTIYDVSNVEDVILDQGNVDEYNLSYLAEQFLPYIIGYTVIRMPRNPCRNAYQIQLIAGPGKLVYGVAYATSPSGRLISDRSSMTDAAINAWKNMSSKTSRRRLPLDDVDAHDPSGNEIKPHAHHTSDLEDDCRLRDEDFLNYAYESEGWEQSLYAQLKEEHTDFVARLFRGKLSASSVVTIEEAIDRAGNTFFNKKYH